MSTIVTRASKGSILTSVEMDANLNNLNADKIESNTASTAVGNIAAYSTTGGRQIKVASAADIVAAIGATAVQRATTTDTADALNEINNYTVNQMAAATSMRVGGGSLKTCLMMTDANSAYYYADGNAYFGSYLNAPTFIVSNSLIRATFPVTGELILSGNTLLFDSGTASIKNAPDANWGLRYKPSQNGSSAAHAWANATNTTVAHLTGTGDFSAVGNITATGGLGYGAGAGGTVTQATSRTTAVTINKPTGAITMFSAAGSATPAQFTVQNSLVAATDVVVLSYKSSSNVYQFVVSNVAAGSFNISFWAQSGVASDTPVINFAIIKGATS